MAKTNDELGQMIRDAISEIQLDQSEEIKRVIITFSPEIINTSTNKFVPKGNKVRVIIDYNTAEEKIVSF